jgi:hypothetical protein
VEFIVCAAKERHSICSMKPLLFIAGSAALLVGCAPQREFVRFGNPGTFQPSNQSTAILSGPTGEYDSYEVIDHGAPNHGYPPMYSGGGYASPAPAFSHPHDGGYPKVVDTYDQFGNPRSVIIPQPW